MERDLLIGDGSLKQLPFPKLVIFDLDGTLVDSAADIGLAANQTFERLDLPLQPLPQIKQWIGGGAQVFVEKALDYFGKPEWFERAYPLFMKHYKAVPVDATVIFEGVKVLLEHLQQLAIPMAVVSNKPHELIVPILEHFALDRYFEPILGGDSLTQKKPNPEPLFQVCRQFALEPEQCWMIGDSSKDAQAAVNAAMSFIGVSYGYAMSGSDIRPPQIPHQVVDNLEHLIPLIKAEQQKYA